MNEALHALARETAVKLCNPDKKQLRMNEIVNTAKRFYANDPAGGVIELVRACDRAETALYVHKAPMWETLQTQYGWMA